VSREKSGSVIGGKRRFENLHVSRNVVLRVSDFGYCEDCENRWTWFKCWFSVSTRGSGQWKSLFAL